MISTVASKAERLVPQRLESHVQVARLMAGISPAQIIGDIPLALVDRLDHPRFRKRLERRFLRKARVGGVLPDLLGSDAESVAAHGEYGLQALIVDAGIVCHYAALRKIVHSESLAELGKLLGIALDRHDARLVKASDSLSLAHLINARSPEGMEPLAAAILHDGLQCWACWIHRQPESLHRFFHQLTPPILQARDLQVEKGCTKRERGHRATLFDVRRALVAETDDMPVRRKA